MLRAVSSSLARALGIVALKRSAATAFPAQGGLSAAHYCQKTSQEQPGQAPEQQQRPQAGTIVSGQMATRSGS